MTIPANQQVFLSRIFFRGSDSPREAPLSHWESAKTGRARFFKMLDSSR
jgi:hypothetical protein